MIVGLDCAEPSLLLERYRDELPVLLGPDGARRLRAADLGDPPDHRAGVVLHDGEPNLLGVYGTMRGTSLLAESG